MTSSFCFCTSFLLPSSLWGGVGGGGRAMWLSSAMLHHPPPPTLPHKGGGRRKASYPLHIERWFLTGAVAFERAFLADRVGALEDPVLPGSEAGKDFRFHGLGTCETQVGFETGEAVGREARALFKEHAHLVPVDVIKR